MVSKTVPEIVTRYINCTKHQEHFAWFSIMYRKGSIWFAYINVFQGKNNSDYWLHELNQQKKLGMFQEPIRV